MPVQRITMRRIRQVLRLKYECRLSYAEIARSLGLAKGSVFNYLPRAESAGLTYEVAARTGPRGAARAVAPGALPLYALRRARLCPGASGAEAQGRDADAFVGGVFEAAQGGPYSRSRFFERYQAFVRGLRRSMSQTHVAGEKLFVDFAGQTVPVIDRVRARSDARTCS